MSPALQFNATLFNLKEHCFTEESKKAKKQARKKAFQSFLFFSGGQISFNH